MATVIGVERTLISLLLARGEKRSSTNRNKGLYLLHSGAYVCASRTDPGRGGKLLRHPLPYLAAHFDSGDWQAYYALHLLLILLGAGLPWPPRKRHLIFSPPSSLSMRPSVVENEFKLICMTDKHILYLFNRRSYAMDLEPVKEWVQREREGWGEVGGGTLRMMSVHVSCLQT